MLELVPENEVPFLPKEKETVYAPRCEDQRGQTTRFMLIVVALISALVSTIGTILIHALLPTSPIASSISPLRQELLPSLDLPPLGSVLRTYMGEPAYYSKDMNVSREAWMSLFPAGMGYVSIDKIKDVGDIPRIFQDMSTDGSGRFGVAAFHQLHCLFSIYTDFRRALSGELSYADAHSLHDAHVLHCFDYLRESIICAADSALEPFRSPFDGGGTKGDSPDGFGSVHQCRDFKQLFEWSERFCLTDKTDADKFQG